MNRSTVARSVTRLLGHPWVEWGALRLTTGKLRVLAYHGVDDPESFAKQLDHLTSFHVPVSGGAVVRALDGADRLPPRGVWVTFDDGRPEVVELAMPLLAERHIPATLFVCPGLVGTNDPFWWDVVDAALRSGQQPELEGRRWSGAELTTRLKSLPDQERRSVVDRLRAGVERRGPLEVRQLSVDDLRRWLEGGNEIGNHSWDHPCLDRCEPSEQARQVERAHDELCALLGRAPEFFAYPNGTWTAVTDNVLRELGYRIGLVCDHRLSSVRRDPLRFSRLRVDADAQISRYRAILSGAHSGVFRVADRVIGAGWRARQ